MIEVIRISSLIFLVKEIIDSNMTVIVSYNIENSTRSFSPAQKDWDEASKKFPVENLDLIPELLNTRKDIDEEEEEREQEMANWDINNFHLIR